MNQDDAQRAWQAVIAAGVKAQRLVPGAVAVGGTAAALYAAHRVSQDTDHLLPDLRANFTEVLERLESSGDWKTARVQPPVLILGSIGGIKVGLRQSRRTDRIESVSKPTPSGSLTVPTLDELIGMKAYLAYSRNAVRDYLDFAALSTLADEHGVIAALLKSDLRYGHLQSASVALEIAKRLVEPIPFDLQEVNLGEYKGLSPEWQAWSRTAQICRRFGTLLGERLVMDGRK